MAGPARAEFDVGVAQWYGYYTIDEVRVYNRALSPAEVSAIYNAEKP